MFVLNHWKQCSAAGKLLQTSMECLQEFQVAHSTITSRYGWNSDPLLSSLNTKIYIKCNIEVDLKVALISLWKMMDVMEIIPQENEHY